MGQLKSKEASKDGKDGLHNLEDQWMDPHKRKILEATEDVIAKCREGYAHGHHALDAINSIRRLCLLIYLANDFELIQKCQNTFPSLVRVVRDPNTPFLLRGEIVSAVSLLCHGNQVNCRSWCAEGGMKALLDHLREIPTDRANDLVHHDAMQVNVWLIYTLRTLLYGSVEAIKAVVGNEDFPKYAELLAKMYELQDVWEVTSEGKNYALDCCVLLGIKGKKTITKPEPIHCLGD